MNLIGVASAFLSVGAFALCYRCLEGKSRLTRLMACLALGILAIPAILFAAYYLHILPEREWFYELRSYRGSELCVVFLGAAGGALAALLPRYLLIIPLGVTIGTAAIPYLKMAITPLEAGKYREHWKGDACLQSTASTCGPASLASIMKHLGIVASEREIADAAYTTSSGTEAWYLARYARVRGLSAEFEFRDTLDLSIQFPAIVGVRIGNYGHFIAVLSASKESVKYVDPLSGMHVTSLKEFMGNYTFTGFHLVVGNVE